MEQLEGGNIMVDFNEENVMRRQFYLRNRPFLANHPIGEIPYHIRRHITVMFHHVALHPHNDWKEIAYYLGIDDNMVIASIGSAAFSHGEMPLFYALDKVLHNTSYVRIIDALLKLQRDDILAYLVPYTKDLLHLNEVD